MNRMACRNVFTVKKSIKFDGFQMIRSTHIIYDQHSSCGCAQCKKEVEAFFKGRAFLSDIDNMLRIVEFHDDGTVFIIKFKLTNDEWIESIKVNFIH